MWRWKIKICNFLGIYYAGKHVICKQQVFFLSDLHASFPFLTLSQWLEFPALHWIRVSREEIFPCSWSYGKKHLFIHSQLNTVLAVIFCRCSVPSQGISLSIPNCWEFLSWMGVKFCQFVFFISVTWLFYSFRLSMRLGRRGQGTILRNIKLLWENFLLRLPIFIQNIKHNVWLGTGALVI